MTCSMCPRTLFTEVRRREILQTSPCMNSLKFIADSSLRENMELKEANIEGKLQLTYTIMRQLPGYIPACAGRREPVKERPMDQRDTVNILHRGGKASG
jgi:hypothetical protein